MLHYCYTVFLPSLLSLIASSDCLVFASVCFCVSVFVLVFLLACFKSIFFLSGSFDISFIISPNEGVCTRKSRIDTSFVNTLLIILTRYLHVQPFARTNAYYYSFVPSTCSVWNSLPSSVTQCSTLTSFKSSLGNFLL